MKHRVIAALFFFTIGTSSTYSQNKCGIYLSVQDYKNHQLKYETDCKKEKNPVHLNDVFTDKAPVTIVIGDKKISFKKDAIYGFADCNNNIYRFYNNIKYKIEEPGNICIYSRQVRDIQSKVFKLVKMYYFSVAADTEIIPLSLGNIKNAYRNNQEFVEALDVSFSNSDISGYDDFYQTYKINHIYQVSIRK